VQTGRIPNRSGMTPWPSRARAAACRRRNGPGVGAQDGGYKTFFTGKWHLGEADYALPNAQGYDEMKYAGLYHLNAYTYAIRPGSPTWIPSCARCSRTVTKGAMSARRAAGEGEIQDQRPVRQHAATQGRGRHSVLRRVRREGRARLSRPAAQVDQPFFMSVNFMKVHQPNMPHPTSH
jgi:arylsulfatase